MVKCPQVAESPIHLECRYTQSMSMLSDNIESHNTTVFGEVIGIHISDQVTTNNRIDPLKLRPIGRLGHLDFVEVNNIFSLERPRWGHR